MTGERRHVGVLGRENSIGSESKASAARPGKAWEWGVDGEGRSGGGEGQIPGNPTNHTKEFEFSPEPHESHLSTLSKEATWVDFFLNPFFWVV